MHEQQLNDGVRQKRPNKMYRQKKRVKRTENTRNEERER